MGDLLKPIPGIPVCHAYTKVPDKYERHGSQNNADTTVSDEVVGHLIKQRGSFIH